MSELSKYKFMLAVAGCACSVALAGPAFANTTFFDSTNSYEVGIGPDGELYDDSTGVGLRNPAGSDYIAPGTPRDSWGIASSAGDAYADYEYTGTSANITGTTTTTGANSATTVTSTNFGLTVTQAFNFLNPNIVSIQETVTNDSASTETGVVFRRDVDYDVYPTEFNENTVGPFGANANVVGASYYGFENPDPASGPFANDCSVSCNQQGDLGAGIDYSIGTLAAGQSQTFAFYYGINEPGQTLSGLFSEAATEGLNYYIGTQSSENGDYPNLGSGAALLGVSSIGTVAATTPEPATWAMMLAGFGFIGYALRKRNSRVTLAYA